MLTIGRRQLLLGTALLVGAGGAIALGGCSESGGSGVTSAEDFALGDENAPVTLIEYASTTCGHCAEFHRTSWEQLKTNYIDTGKVRFILREFPTDPAHIAVAGFQLARCGGASPDQYFTRIGVLFDQQRAIFATGSNEGVQQKLVDIGAAAGLSRDQVLQCISDESGAARIRNTVESARGIVTGTPTFVINGVKHEGAATYEAISAALDAAGAAG